MTTSENQGFMKCMVTGKVKPKSDLLRFVIGPENCLFPDLLEKLPGKGIWVCSDYRAIQQAEKKDLFSIISGQKVRIPEHFLVKIENQISQRVLDFIGLARKSGKAVCGYEKVKDWIAKEIAKVIVQSSDGSERGKSKLKLPAGLVLIDWLNSDELGKAFGREKVIHCALASSGVTQRVVQEALRLKGIRAGSAFRRNSNRMEKVSI